MEAGGGAGGCPEGGERGNGGHWGTGSNRDIRVGQDYCSGVGNGGHRRDMGEQWRGEREEWGRRWGAGLGGEGGRMGDLGT